MTPPDLELHPMPGFVLVEPLPQYGEDVVSGLELPDSISGRVRDVAKIVEAVGGRLRYCGSCGFQQQTGNLCQKCGNDDVRYLGRYGEVSAFVPGWYCLFSVGTLVDVGYGKAVVPIDEVLMLSEEADALGFPDRGGMDRCQKCGPAKSGSPNTMLLINGKCPRCGWER